MYMDCSDLCVCVCAVVVCVSSAPFRIDNNVAATRKLQKTQLQMIVHQSHIHTAFCRRRRQTHAPHMRQIGAQSHLRPHAPKQIAEVSTSSQRRCLATATDLALLVLHIRAWI